MRLSSRSLDMIPQFKKVRLIELAFTKPPSKDCLSFNERKCPIIVALHGSGVEYSKKEWLEAVNQQEYAWVLLPSGRTSWGFDWHGPSFKNIDSSVEALNDQPGVPDTLKQDCQAHTERLIIIGHSNGGQGAWWYASHYPDRVIAVIPVAGFVKIQMYAPSYMHLGYGYADPVLRAVIASD